MALSTSIRLDSILVLVLGVRGFTRSTSNAAHSYFINGIVLSRFNSARDLGVVVDSSLSYKTQINNCFTKTYQRTGVLFHGFLCRDLDFLRKAFVTYIRPLVEYNSVIWSPTHKTYIDLLEKIQRRFTKRIPCMRDLPYLDRLAKINLPSLELRRLHFDLCNYFKIFHNLTPIDPGLIYKYHVPPTSVRQNVPFIEKPRNCSNKFLSSFIYRSIDCWNFLPGKIKQISNINKFKAAITQIDLSSFLRGSCYTNLNNYNIVLNCA